MTTPTSAAQPDPAPPSDAEVEAALGELCGYNEGDFTRTGTVLGSCIDALRSENAALAAERDEAKKQAEIAVNSQRTICRAAERLTAERDALRLDRKELLDLANDWRGCLCSGDAKHDPSCLTCREVAVRHRCAADLESALGGEGAE